MVMKRHRQGSVSSSLQALLSFPTTTSFHEGYTKQCSTSTRIIADSMLLRQQKIFLIPPMQHCYVVPDSEVSICPHFLFSSHENICDFSRALRVEHWTSLEGSRFGDSGLRCKYCVTEFRIDFRWTRDRTVLMFVTKWMDLGRGCSPLEREWQGRDANYFSGEHLSTPVNFEPGSICARFEGKEYSEFKFDGLMTPHDRKKLLKRSPYSWPEFDLTGRMDFA
jgi:hypothetical protein